MFRYRYAFRANGKNYLIRWTEEDITPEMLAILDRALGDRRRSEKVEAASDQMIAELFRGMDSKMQSNILEIMKLTQVEI